MSENVCIRKGSARWREDPCLRAGEVIEQAAGFSAPDVLSAAER